MDAGIAWTTPPVTQLACEHACRAPQRVNNASHIHKNPPGHVPRRTHCCMHAQRSSMLHMGRYCVAFVAHAHPYATAQPPARLSEVVATKALLAREAGACISSSTNNIGVLYTRHVAPGATGLGGEWKYIATGREQQEEDAAVAEPPPWHAGRTGTKRHQTNLGA